MLRPRYSNLGLSVTLAVFLFVTYFFMIPTIVRRYQEQLDGQQAKFDKFISKLEYQEGLSEQVRNSSRANNDLIRENNRILKECLTLLRNSLHEKSEKP